MAEREKHVAALDQVLELALLVNADMTQSLAKIGLTPSRTHLLWEVYHRGSSTQKTLAEALKVSARNVTGLVDGLVEGGFVTREPHLTDRRATLVTLTSHGSAVMAEMAAARLDYAELLFGDMSTPRFDGFTKGLGTVLETLRRHITRDVEIHA